MEIYAVLAIILGVVAFLAYRARGTVGTYSDAARNPKRPARDPIGMGGPGNDLIDPGPRDGNTRPLE
jgi:hypothetical protein